MNDLKKSDLEKLSFDDILRLKQEYESYIDIIDEYVITSKTDLNGHMVYTSRAFESISGYSKSELLGKSHNIIRHPDMPKSVFKEMWDTITKEKVWSGEIKNRKKDGSYYWVNTKVTPTYDNYGNHIGYTSVRQDITDKKKIEELSLIDELTGLYNRRYYKQIISKEINRAIRDKKVFFFIIIDIDNFKKYNDNYGHQSGDHALKAFGNFLNHYFKRSSDFVFRFGGEEFCAIFTTNTPKQGIKLTQNLCSEIEKLHIEHSFNTQVSRFLTASAGLAVCDFSLSDFPNIDCDTLYEKADMALYDAKRSGRNQIKVTNLIF